MRTIGFSDVSARCTCQSAITLALDCPIHGDAVKALVVEAIDDDRLIQEQPPGRCDLCGAVKETRPYGPNGENVCFECGPGSGDPAAVRAAEAAFGRRIDVRP